MYDAYALVPEPNAAFPVGDIRSHLDEMPAVLEDPRNPANKYLFCSSPEHASSLRKILEAKPDTDLPPVGVVVIRPDMLLIYQETTSEVVQMLKEFVQWVMSRTPSVIEDLEGNVIFSKTIKQFDRLFE